MRSGTRKRRGWRRGGSEVCTGKTKNEKQHEKRQENYEGRKYSTSK